MSCTTVEASMKLTSKISIRYDELYFAGVWVISPVRRFPRRRISSRTPWSRVDPKPFSLDLWCFRTTLWLWTWIVKLVRRFFFAKFILLHIRNVISSPFFSSLLSRYFQRNIVLRQIVAILFHFVKRYRQIEENK